MQTDPAQRDRVYLDPDNRTVNPRYKKFRIKIYVIVRKYIVFPGLL